MITTLWNWLFVDEKEVKAKSLLLSKCLRRRYQRQKKAIITIQRFIRQANIRYDLEEQLHLTISRCQIKKQSNLFLV